MNLTQADLKRLVAPLALAAVLLACGAALIFAAHRSLAGARQALAAAQAERARDVERLARIAEEEREVRAKLDVYRRLKDLHVLGEERRLEWADAIARIRTQRELLDLRYRVERQKLLASLPGKPGSVDFYASSMKVDIALLHEEDLLRFLTDLRASGNAYYSVRSCVMERMMQPAALPTAIAPRLHAQCDVDLITIIDRAAKG